ncbi:kelch repeat [Chlorella sorokiniana]|uniref:Kelch repeat n=1 Tax=Chlorella sorokiniana TaxID=3076 RepID=A0A2P6TV70_CHLSO|nr:kelch repeat [Chlorella sorokiniana]|eukprot:PRW57948.1 kelch repeat [Chlorella sorokiniana]
MLICGGFGGGILSGGDLHLLTPAKRSSNSSNRSGSPGGSGSSSPSACGGNASASSGLRWVQPNVSGRPPVHRYGHTLTRCGEQAVLFGGLQAGGYQAPLDTLAVLRRRAPAAGTAGAADAARNASGSDGDCDSGGGGSEQDMSLALQHGGWQGGADGGGLQQLLWAQMFDFFMGQDEEEEEEEEDDEEEELLGSDSQDAASSGSEYGSAEEEEEEADSEEDWLPGHNVEAAGAAARPASVVAAMARRSSSPESPGAAAAVDGLHQPVAGPSPATGGAASAAGAAAWGDEDASLANEELEWFYPRVSGEAPGARGYHSAAASEDGTKLYVFGGISATGACNTLAVLDLHTWEWSRPHTHGAPPSPRCGHSSFVHGNRLWVVGGGSGRDLLRSGRDLADAHCLDLTTMEWRRLALPPGPLCAGKCHASALVGRRLLLFGGSMASCNELAWLDLEREEWGAPLRVLGPPPCERMSATAVLCGEEVVVFGGYTFSYREPAAPLAPLQPQAQPSLKRAGSSMSDLELSDAEAEGSQQPQQQQQRQRTGQPNYRLVLQEALPPSIPSALLPGAASPGWSSQLPPAPADAFAVVPWSPPLVSVQELQQQAERQEQAGRVEQLKREHLLRRLQLKFDHEQPLDVDGGMQVDRVLGSSQGVLIEELPPGHGAAGAAGAAAANQQPDAGGGGAYSALL